MRDRIIVLEAGRTVQDGAYDDLLGQPGLFRCMMESDSLHV